MTAKAVQAAAGAYLTARLPPDRPAAGNPRLGVPQDRGTRGACQLHFGLGSFARRAGGASGFPVGASCGRPCPSWVMVYAPPRFHATPATASWSCGWAACPLGELGVNGADVREDGSLHR